MTDHVCASCAKAVPACGHKRKVSEGYCRDFASKNPNEMRK